MFVRKSFLITAVLLFVSEFAFAASANGRVKMTVIRTNVISTVQTSNSAPSQTYTTTNTTSPSQKNSLLVEVIY